MEMTKGINWKLEIDKETYKTLTESQKVDILLSIAEAIEVYGDFEGCVGVDTEEEEEL